VPNEIEKQHIPGTNFYKIHRDTLEKLTKKNALRRNHIQKLEATIKATHQ
jgi:hypothetical protein